MHSLNALQKQQQHLADTRTNGTVCGSERTNITVAQHNLRMPDNSLGLVLNESHLGSGNATSSGIGSFNMGSVSRTEQPEANCNFIEDGFN